MTQTAKTHIGWNSRWTFIMAATGSAVGLGNIWKFPYITGENGGGAFVLVYLLCIAIVGVPVLISEILIGRHGRSNPVNATMNLARASDTTKAWAIIGIMGAVAGLMVMSFYSVVAGWVLDYIVASAKGTFTGASAETVGQYFDTLQADKQLQLTWHTGFALLTVAVVAAGVTRGLGNAVRILMPLLFVLLITLLGYSYSQGDFSKGFHFLFDADFSKLTGESVLIAMGHAFFTLSVGMGAIMAYGSYMPSNASIAKTALTITFLDTLIALVAGLAIFPLVFANGIEPGKGAGLMFVSLPIAFGAIPGGLIFGTLFFVLVGIAAWSSSISLIEPAVAWLDENFKVNRAISAVAIGLVFWGGGLACIYQEGVFDMMDHISSNIMLPLGGLLTAIFAGWFLKRKIAKTELKDLSYTQFNIWYATTRVFTPIGIIVVFAHSLGLF